MDAGVRGRRRTFRIALRNRAAALRERVRRAPGGRSVPFAPSDEGAGRVGGRDGYAAAGSDREQSDSRERRTVRTAGGRSRATLERLPRQQRIWEVVPAQGD